MNPAYPLFPLPGSDVGEALRSLLRIVFEAYASNAFLSKLDFRLELDETSVPASPRFQLLLTGVQSESWAEKTRRTYRNSLNPALPLQKVPKTSNLNRALAPLVDKHCSHLQEIDLITAFSLLRTLTVGCLTVLAYERMRQDLIENLSADDFIDYFRQGQFHKSHNPMVYHAHLLL